MGGVRARPVSTAEPAARTAGWSIGWRRLAGLAEWNLMNSSERPSRYPVEVTYLPVVRCAVCRRTVAHRLGHASAVLTKHYRRAHPEMLTVE